MRESLTILASLMILILAAALVGPYFVDWPAQKGFLEARLSEFSGTDIHLNGRIDLKLLPSPYLELTTVEMGRGTRSFHLFAEKLQLELSIAPLLRGEFDFLEARLQSPTLRLRLDEESPARPMASNVPKKLKFERISLRDATILCEAADGRRLPALRGLDLDAEAASLLGPFKGQGLAKIAGRDSKFNVSTSAWDQGSLGLKLHVDSNATDPSIDLMGSVFVTPGALSASRFTGQMQVEHGADWPWRLKTKLEANLQNARLEAIELKLGEDDHPATALGEATLDYGRAPRANLNLTLASLDLSRIWPRDTEQEIAARLRTHVKAFFEPSNALASPLPLSLKLSIGALTLTDTRFSDISAAFSLTPGEPARLHLQGVGASQSKFSLDGTIETGAAAGFSGKIDWAGNGLRALPDFFAEALPDWAASLVSHGAISQNFQAHGTFNITRAGFFARDLDLRQGASELTGTLNYVSASAAERAHLFAALNAARLDLTGLPNLKDTLAQSQALDLSLQLGAQALSLAPHPETRLALSHFKLKLIKTGDEFKLEELALHGSQGMALNAKGAFNKNTAHLEGALDAQEFAEFAELLPQVLPGPAPIFSASQSQALSPMNLRFAGDFDVSATQLSLNKLTLDGKAGRSILNAELAQEKEGSRALKFSAHGNAPEGTALLQQLGIAARPSEPLGPSNFAISAHAQHWGEAFQTGLHAVASGSSLDFSGMILADLEKPRAEGQLQVKSADLDPFLRVLSLKLDGKLPLELSGSVIWDASRFETTALSGKIGQNTLSGTLLYAEKKLKGEIAAEHLAMAGLFDILNGPRPSAKPQLLWPDQPFGNGLFIPAETSLKLKAKTFELWPGIEGENAGFSLEISPQDLIVNDFSSQIGQGSAKARLHLHRDGKSAAFEGKGELKDFALDLPLLRGKLGLSLNLAGAGQNSLALVRNLAGSGVAGLSGLTLLRSDSRALRRVVEKFKSEALLPRRQDIEAAFEEEFSKAPLALKNYDFTLDLSDGKLRFEPLAMKDGNDDRSAVAKLSGTFDLTQGLLSETTRFTQRELPKDWSAPPPEVGLGFKGPLMQPSREIEAGAFLNALAEQIITKESARLEGFEFDRHEQAFFWERLRGERRREQEKLKQQEKAEEDRRRAIEAARLERLRKEEARRKVEERPKPLTPPAKPLNAPNSQAQPVDPSSAGRY